MSFLKTAILILTLALASELSSAQDLTVAAAADLQFAMQDIAARFQKDSGKQVKVIYGSSGAFVQQIENGAPFDVFFSANLDYPKQLDAASLVEPGSMYQYATSKLVLWVPKHRRSI